MENFPQLAVSLVYALQITMTNFDSWSLVLSPLFCFSVKIGVTTIRPPLSPVFVPLRVVVRL